ncbi:glycosyltransferase family 2 protein [Telluria beijingensis]|uniref:glycosyltransferase family 2 protein n=1 Tax=Telluria beijingensis TaxID=3068633 RepID=UPI0027956F16|nr:glycosyltransferase family 2 protein [Massilia sp. REN29]
MTNDPTLAEPQPRWRGALDGLHDGHLYGWAFDSQRPDARVVLELCLDGEPFGSAVADVARSDLAGRLPGAADTCHGFVADLRAFELGPEGILSARVANTDAALAGAIARTQPKAPPRAAASRVFGDGGLRLHGWALDPASPKRQLTVHAYVGHDRVASATASLEHAALRSHEVGAHGFTLDLPLALADGRPHQVRVVDAEGQPLGGSPLQVCCLADGMRALLPDLPGTAADLVATYERVLPRSLGLEQFRTWAAQFDPTPATADDGPGVALVVVGADGPLLDATRAGVAAQTHRQVALFEARRDRKRVEPFAALLARALESGCEFVACLRAGDVLVPQALACALEGFALPGAELVYTDSERGGKPWFKPAWNPDYALASDYPLDLLLIRADAVRALLAGALPPAGPAALAWRMLARAWPRAEDAIVHVPHVLCRCEAPLDVAELAQRHAAAQAALAEVEPGAVLEAAPPIPGLPFAPRRARRPLSPAERQLGVTLMIPTRDHAGLLRRCIDTIARHTADWPRLEIIVIDNGSAEPETLAYFGELAQQGVKVLAMPGPFNFATLNNAAVEAASGEIVGLVNNDIEALHDGWLDELVGQLLRPGVGAVGAKLLWPNGVVQHGGVLLGQGGLAGHFGNRLADADPGDHGRNQLAQQVSGVTAACLLLRKRDYLAVGGMDERAFPVAFNDVDLCLKLRAAGLAITWTPYARLLHAESASRGKEDTPQKRARAGREMDQLRRRWGTALLRDPAYHPSLNLDVLSQAFGGLALPPRDRSPRTAALARPNEEYPE